MNRISLKIVGQGVSQIVLNRPPVNALNSQFLKEINDMLLELRVDDNVKSVLISSNLKTFSAGLDLKEAQGFNLDDQSSIVKGLNETFLTLFTFPKPVICMVNGPAIAGGLFFALGSDVVISSASGSFGLAEVLVGARFPVAPLEIARHTLHPSLFRTLMLRGTPIDARRAFQFGLVDELTTEDEIFEVGLKEAIFRGGIPTTAYKDIKKSMRAATEEIIVNTLSNGLDKCVDEWFTEETKPAMEAMIGRLGARGDK